MLTEINLSCWIFASGLILQAKIFMTKTHGESVYALDLECFLF